jgi:ABC-type phosphate transport system substrate-binding protein
MLRNASGFYFLLLTLLTISTIAFSCSKPEASTAEATKPSIQLTGARSTFAFPLYSKWSEAIQRYLCCG